MVIVYSEYLHPRLQYALDIVFREVLHINYMLVDNIDIIINSDDPTINYSDKSIENTLNICPHGLLSREIIENINLSPGRWNNLPTLFHNDKGTVPFDLFSAVFYMVSRYEEYLPFKEDQYGRFEADQSIASKAGFLNLPVVELWCSELAKYLNIFSLCKGVQPDNYSFRLTVDIDQAWVYKYKGFFRNSFSLLRDVLLLRFKEFQTHLKTLLSILPDPGYTYTAFKQAQSHIGNKISYFILCRSNGKYDKNISPGKDEFKRLIRTLNTESNVGIHPSYKSNNSVQLLKEEIKRLYKITGNEITASRQHYLIIKLPETFENLIQQDITSDYSIGYASKTGFRAGIARPYFFYNLKKEEATKLRIVPFQVMDRTVQSYMNLTPDEAIREFEYYTNSIRNVGGTFVALWHNTSISNVSEWKGWKKVFERMIEINKKND
ncbi:MAG: polysaccharide deacetylase family protein [Bacteroidales bacterium]|nr:polysaccharide deacetylase family protein [Bacteroidales bacterium]